MLRHIPRQTADVKVEMDDLFLMIRDVSRHVCALSASRLRFSLSPAVLISAFFFFLILTLNHYLYSLEPLVFSYYMISRCITSAMCMGEKVPPLDVLMVIGGGGGGAVLVMEKRARGGRDF